MDGRIEPPRPVLEADRRENPFSECALQLGRVGNVEERRVDPRRLTHQLGEHRADRVEDLRNLGRLHQRLEVVQERGVGRVVPVEALGIAPLQLEVPLERREECGEVVVRAGVDPDLVSLCRSSQHLGAEVGRDLPRLFPVATCHANQARVVRVVLQ